jgi:hypothetical protein
VYDKPVTRPNALIQLFKLDLVGIGLPNCSDPVVLDGFADEG